MSTNSKTGVSLITMQDITLGEEIMLSTKQLNFLMQRTPAQHVYKRQAKGGGEWTYVKTSYVSKVLNLMFGWNWSFEVKEYKYDLAVGQCFVQGKLTVNVKGQTITKEQFGRADIKFKTEPVYDEQGKPVYEMRNGKSYPKRQSTNLPLDLGNDLKGATSDALKKCASLLGIAADVYAPEEFKEVEIVSDKDETSIRIEISDLLSHENLVITDEERDYIDRILHNNETESYAKVLKVLKSKLKK